MKTKHTPGPLQKDIGMTKDAACINVKHVDGVVKCSVASGVLSALELGPKNGEKTILTNYGNKDDVMTPVLGQSVELNITPKDAKIESPQQTQNNGDKELNGSYVETSPVQNLFQSLKEIMADVDIAGVKFGRDLPLQTQEGSTMLSPEQMAVSIPLQTLLCAVEIATQGKVNAQLIASAPELLAALTKLVKDASDAWGKHTERLSKDCFTMPFSIDEAIKAIAKAKGEVWLELRMINYEIKLNDDLIEKSACDLLVFEKMIGRFALRAHSIRKSINSIEFYTENKSKPIGSLAYEEDIYEITWESESV